jgi:hypothetical protein
MCASLCRLWVCGVDLVRGVVVVVSRFDVNNRAFEVLDVSNANHEEVPQPVYIHDSLVYVSKDLPKENMRKFQDGGVIRLDCNRLWSCPADISSI